MAYDEKLANRVDAVLDALDPPMLVDKKMFGGIGFDLIVRVGKDAYPEAIAFPETKPFDITGRAMTGWVMVPEQFLQDEEELIAWVCKGMDFALTLPAK